MSASKRSWETEEENKGGKSPDNISPLGVRERPLVTVINVKRVSSEHL
jgi:hypothetical protein